MRIAHISDLHILDLAGISPTRFLNKRLTGYANLAFRRKHQHRAEHVIALCEAIQTLDVDHIVVTGDLTNLALESEFTAVKRLLETHLRRSAKDVSIIPGNHDCYTRGAARKHRFESFFAANIESDLAIGGRAFPFVRVRGPLAIIGMSSAVVRPPFMAAGFVDQEQRAAVTRILGAPELRDRTPVFLLHHPLQQPLKKLKALRDGLHDAEALAEVLGSGILLHGHLHRRVAWQTTTKQGQLRTFGATSASLEHGDPARMAGVNLYEFDAKGSLTSAKAQVLTETGALAERAF
jgi:3',5'-cyclic AMP phosphodiesterase CpdA